MKKCSFCDATTEAERLPDGWGSAVLQIPGVEKVSVTFCPLHQVEAEKALDEAFEKAKQK